MASPVIPIRTTLAIKAIALVVFSIWVFVEDRFCTVFDVEPNSGAGLLVRLAICLLAIGVVSLHSYYAIQNMEEILNDVSKKS